MVLHQQRQSGSGDCPWGGFYQSCATGFEGCCLVDACTTGCPAGKDRINQSGNSRDTVRESTRNLAATSTSVSNVEATTTSEVVKSSAHGTTTSSPSAPSITPSLLNDIVTSLSAGRTVYVTVNPHPTGSPTPTDAVPFELSHKNHSLPTAAIIGGTLGGAISLKGMIGKFALYRSGSGASQPDTPQLDSREIGRKETTVHGSGDCFHELAGEPIPWPGQPGTGRSF
ncbi:hypothetical protein T440DRAFT_491826 [Plenodomus tracheiphilus IPT5]|uniref:Uncharacterized protein n=1 Tax=Plenodomus tracheiphilus IPT5 TaxID=1408161 RepID=A0A6A7AX06_9PLEO|nr:hypothetical protein T440DRAFT_491826 [Plenodomus tracheiphilus IPT5]